jgi:hypothetical protein
MKRGGDEEGVLLRLRTQLLASVRRTPSIVVGAMLFVSVVLFFVWRVQRGVDLSDEAFYVSIPMRFALGDRPFLDDRSTMQGSGILLTPLVFAYHLVVRSNAGLVLFMRCAYLAYLVGIGLAIARAVRGWISRGGALACGAITCFFAPYCISQFSYNTMGGGLALLAAVCSLRVCRAATAKEGARYAALAGFAAAGSALSYPTLALVFPVHLTTLLVFGRAHLGARRVALWFVIGAAILGAYVGAFLVRSGFGSLQLTNQFIHAWGPTLTNTVANVIDTVNLFKTNWFSSLAIAALITAVATRIKPFVLVLAIAVPFLAMPTTHGDYRVSVRFFSCCALFAPFFGALVHDKKNAFRLLAIVWGPMVLTAFLVGYSSGNVGTATGVGGFGAMIAGCVLACRACEEAAGSFRFLAAPFGLVAPVALLYVLTSRALAPESVYNDDPIDAMTVRIRTGPFRGLWTTEAHRTLVEQMHSDIVQVTEANPKTFVLFYPEMHAAYLSANARPAVPEPWMSGVPGRSEIDAHVFRERLYEVGVVAIRDCVGMRDWFNCKPVYHLPNDALGAAVEEAFKEDFVHGDYAVLKRR